MLWAWETDVDLRFLKPSDAGVAWLAMTIYFDATGTAAEPRAATLEISPGVYQMAVVRLEKAPDSRPKWTAAQRRSAVAAIVDVVRITRSRAVQIDFDAPESAHGFYRELITDVRRKLDPGVFLSMTALLSWCAEPRNWLDDFPVDEIVPMSFDSGGPHPPVTEFSDPACRKSLGLMYAPWPGAFRTTVNARPGERIYFFDDQAWSTSEVEGAFEKVAR